MESLIISTIQLFLALLFFAIVMIKLAKCISNEHSNKSNQEFSVNYKIHLLYLCVISSLIIISLITYICIGNHESDKIIDFISFAGTLSSLILSVVAIIFTIVLSKTGAEHNEKMNQAIITLQRTISDFQAKSQKLDSIASKLEKIEKDVDETKSNVSNITASAISSGIVAQPMNLAQPE